MAVYAALFRSGKISTTTMADMVYIPAAPTPWTKRAATNCGILLLPAAMLAPMIQITTPER